MTSVPLALSAAALLAGLSIGSFAQAQSQAPQDLRNQQEQAKIAHAQSASPTNPYAVRRIAYERQRDAYDARYGAGAFARYYAAHPGEYDDRYGPGAYERDFGRPVSYEGP